MKRKRPSLPTGPGLPILPRVFAVLAAILLVGSVALVALMPADSSLGQALRDLTGTAPDRALGLFSTGLPRTLWEAVIVPVLVRPVWLVPVSLGLICVGGTLTALSHASPRTKQRRS